MRLLPLATMSALCCGLVVGACASPIPLRRQAADEADAPAQFARVSPGTTVRGDVTAIAGEPDYVVPSHNVAVYIEDERPGRVRFGCGRDFRFVCGTNRRTSYDMYFIQYNDEDVVERTESRSGDVRYSDVVEWALDKSGE